MQENDKLQELFTNFSDGLREYIRSEVKRQVAESISSSEVEEEEAAVVGSDDAGSVTTPVQDPGFQSPVKKLQDLVGEKSDFVPSSVKPVADQVPASVDSSVGQPLVVADSVADNASAPVSTDKTPTFSRLQGLLDKIKERKKLGKN